MAQLKLHPTYMIHETLHFVYRNILEHFDFFGALGFTCLGIHLVWGWEVFLFKMMATAMLASIGAFAGWVTKIFAIRPTHNWLKEKYPNSKLFQ